MSNVAICLLTHDKCNSNTFSEIKDSLERCVCSNFAPPLSRYHNYDLHTMISVTDGKTHEDTENIHHFTWNGLKKRYGYETRNFRKDYVGISNLALYYLYDICHNYDYYIFYEDDVWFTGFENNVNPFDNIPFDNYDMMFQTPRRIAHDDWWWINHDIKNFPNDWIPYEFLLNIYIISNKTLRELKDFYTTGDGKDIYGHHELLVNSYFMNNQDKYKIGHISDWFNVIAYENVDKLKKDLMTPQDLTNTFLHPIK